MKRRTLAIGIGIWLVFGGGCASEQTVDRSIAPTVTGSRLYDGLDVYHFPITTDSAEAQAWFNQGLLCLYGFNHGEAIRSFREAAIRDPQAAMPYWGIAYANGMHVNLAEISEAQWQAGAEAIEQAKLRIDRETRLEVALINALSARTAWPVPDAQRPYDEAFAAAMTDVYAQWPDHPDVGVIYAESMMNLQPWDYWTADLEPKGKTTTFVRVLERVLERDPSHPQACHLYIHAMEAGPNPERAEAAADALRDRVPGAGHLQHMPSHLYARVGRYADAADVNVDAVAADHAFFEAGTEPGMYWVYHAHNLHFLSFAAMMEGRYDTAMDAARELERCMPEEALDQFAWLIEGIMATPYHVQIRFGKWHDVLEEPAPPAKRPVLLAVHHYARGIALSALGRTDEAREEIALYQAQARNVPEDWWVFSNQIHDVLPIADHMLEGELAFREGRLDDAWRALRAGIEAEDKLIYDEPPAWMLPVRHAMGALLMSAGEYATAEQLYREDQAKHPGNGWSLLGLQQALRAQGRDAEAQVITPQLDIAWRRVDQRPTSSCLCEPGTAPVAMIHGH
ncbi:MAG: hypothetical protein AAF432_02745 [Planctomycetota bacterium]